MISPEVGVRFPSRYHHVNWPADCLLGFSTAFYSLTLRYFFHDLDQMTLQTPLGRELGSISATLFVSGLRLSPKNNN